MPSDHDLSDEQVDEIAAKNRINDKLVISPEIDALCATVKALRTDIALLQIENKSIKELAEFANETYRKQAERIVDELRSQLEEVERERDQLKQILVRTAIPYESLLLDNESRKWIAPTIWREIETTITAIREVLK